MPRKSASPRGVRAAAPPGFCDVPLTARVLVPTEPPRASQAEVCELFDCSEQTVRNWIRRGMPVHGTAKRPWFVAPEVVAWVAYYQHRLRQGGGQAPRVLPYADALRWHLEVQARDLPGAWVLVPLEWDHPERERLLRRAAEGNQPPEDDDA